MYGLFDVVNVMGYPCCSGFIVVVVFLVLLRGSPAFLPASVSVALRMMSGVWTGAISSTSTS